MNLLLIIDETKKKKDLIGFIQKVIHAQSEQFFR